MYLDAAEKQEIFGKYGKSNSDTGSTEAQTLHLDLHFQYTRIK